MSCLCLPGYVGDADVECKRGTSMVFLQVEQSHKIIYCLLLKSFLCFRYYHYLFPLIPNTFNPQIIIISTATLILFLLLFEYFLAYTCIIYILNT